MDSTPEIRVDCPDEIKFRVVEAVARIVAPQAEVIDVDGIRAFFDARVGAGPGLQHPAGLVLRFEGRDEEAVRRIRGVDGGSRRRARRRHGVTSS